ncbi:MAG: 1,4-alpha-glucan branching protein GlgB [Ilumatobacteraceae bacterium]
MVLPDRDVQLFSEGTHLRLWELLGAHVTAEGVQFAVWAPGAQTVQVIGDWNQSAGGDPLHRQGTSGVWVGVTAAAQVGQRYRFAITSAEGKVVLKADPMARLAEGAPSNASVITGVSQHEWADHDWMRTRTNVVGAPLRVYEVHLGSWRSGVSTYRELGEQLADYVSGLGFTHVELLPIAEYPFGGSWGYQVTGYYAPTSRYGTPDDLRAMVDVLHARDVGVIVDWVPAHFPKDEWGLARFDGTPLYEHADPQLGEHPDWGTYVFDFGRAEVRNFLVANALYWLHEFHIDGLRVDAVTSMLRLDFSRKAGEWTPNADGSYENLEAVAFVRELNVAVRREVPTAMMIAEESHAWPKVTHPIEEGGLGFHLKWNLGWMNDTLKYMHRRPARRPVHHHELTFGLSYTFGERYVLPLSHDEVVHGKSSLLAKMPGDEAEKFANLRALYAWMWALPGAPLLFMGGELAPYAEWNEAEELPWDLLEFSFHRGVRDLIMDLNRVAVDWSALYERDHESGGFEWLDADDDVGATYSFLRWGTDGATAIACVANFSIEPRVDYRIGLPWSGTWQTLLNTDSAQFSGAGHGVDSDLHANESEWQRQPASVVLALPALTVVLLGSVRPL